MAHLVLTLASFLIIHFAFPTDGGAGQKAIPSTSAKGAVLVELFTSEGCSSCPPADALLREINATSTREGRLIVAMSEHVTYWNGLGWADRFSAPAFTQRQAEYSRRLGLDSDYTPQMIVNGRDQFVGSDRVSLQQALHKQADLPESVDLRIKSATVTGDAVRIGYSASSYNPLHHADLFAAITDDAGHSQVARGENSGRLLTHVAIARSITRLIGLSGSSAAAEVTLPLPARSDPTSGRHVILFVQQDAGGPILAVDSRAL